MIETGCQNASEDGEMSEHRAPKIKKNGLQRPSPHDGGATSREDQGTLGPIYPLRAPLAPRACLGASSCSLSVCTLSSHFIFCTSSAFYQHFNFFALYLQFWWEVFRNSILGTFSDGRSSENQFSEQFYVIQLRNSQILC